MVDLLTQWRRKAKDPYFMLSVYGLCLLVLPILIIVLIENFTQLSLLTWNTNFREMGIAFRSLMSSLFKCQPFMIGMGIVVPASGLGMIVIAWSSMLIRHFTSKPPTKKPANPQVRSSDEI